MLATIEIIERTQGGWGITTAGLIFLLCFAILVGR